MKIAVISDIHDNIWNLKEALKLIKKKAINTAIFCGDYCSPTAFMMAVEPFRMCFCIWGNVDGEKFKLTQKVYEMNMKNVKLLGDFGEVEIDKRKVAIIHNPRIAEIIAISGEYDAVFFGHTHKYHSEFRSETLLANPGEVMGISGKPSFGIWDTKSNKMKKVIIK